MKKNLKINVHGRVQGVLFRHIAQEQAEKLGLSGYAQREENGSITIEVDGYEEHLHLFLCWCRRGPLLAKVEMVTHEFFEEPAGHENFEIRENERAIYIAKRWENVNA